MDKTEIFDELEAIIRRNLVGVPEKPFSPSRYRVGSRKDWRIGFACKMVPPLEINGAFLTKAEIKEWKHNHNGMGVSLPMLKTMSTKEAVTYLQKLTLHNMWALSNAVADIGKLPEMHRMYRISSDIWPLFTHPIFGKYYFDLGFRNEVARILKSVGDFARKFKVRLSMHPGQFVVLNSISQKVRQAAVQELQYHTMLANLLGYSGYGEFPINIHVGSNAHTTEKDSIKAFKTGFKELDSSSRKLLTVENDEFSFDIDHTMHLAMLCPLVLDIHHHWLFTEGDYISANDSRIETVISSWRGKRPKLHLSMSCEEYVQPLYGERPQRRPSYELLNERGIARTKLRAHSGFIYSPAVQEWALSFLPWADIMVEAKYKDAAASQLVDRANQLFNREAPHE